MRRRGFLAGVISSAVMPVAARIGVVAPIVPRLAPAWMPGDAVIFSANLMRVYDSSGTLRVKIGSLA